MTVGNDPVSEYDNVAALIQDAFPDLFPCGLTAEMAGGKANLSVMVMRLIFFHTDTRWATCQTSSCTSPTWNSVTRWRVVPQLKWHGVGQS